MDWVFGTGELGRTFVYQQDQRWFESQLSWYRNIDALYLTTGHKAQASATLQEALGTRLEPEDAQSCFACHTTHSSDRGRFDPANAAGDLGCEACHGPGLAHVRRMRDGSNQAGGTDGFGKDAAGRMTDLGSLSPVDSVDFCGACHRT